MKSNIYFFSVRWKEKEEVEHLILKLCLQTFHGAITSL